VGGAHGRVLDASLGYFINPLVNVLLGYAVLHERPRPVQWLAVALAGAGVLWLTLGAGHPALGQHWCWPAASACTACCARRPAGRHRRAGARDCCCWRRWPWCGLLWWPGRARATSASRRCVDSIWLLLAGPFTAVPLLLFAAGARRVSLATLGLLQYVSPSIQFVLGVFLYQEPFSTGRGIGFLLIWAALALYSAESWRVLRRARWRRSRAEATRRPVKPSGRPPRLASVSGAICTCAG
jgi:chloramphenicol-sensitive protein RarD